MLETASQSCWNGTLSVASPSQARRPFGLARLQSEGMRVYQVQNWKEALSLRKGAGGVTRNVVFLGLTSLFTDISAEMVSTVLPLYLVFSAGMSLAAFGVVDGLYQGVAAIAQVASGFASDRLRRHKEVAAAGYALSMLSKLGLLAAGGALPGFAAAIVADRVGKGIRTAPRDALISLSSKPEDLGAAFGVHRALDTAGAMVGPLVAFGLLTLLPGRFDAVFVASFCIAVVGLGVIGMLVRNRAPARRSKASPRVTVRDLAGLLRIPRFGALVLAGAALGAVTTSDSFMFLSVQRKLSFSVAFLPLLYVATSLAYLALAVPFGRLADRLGRGAVFVAGYGLLLSVYVALLAAPSMGVAELIATLFLYGAYYAATDGVLAALASAVLPEATRGSGLALVKTGTGLAGLGSSILFGALWAAGGVAVALSAFALGLAVALPATAIALARATPANVAPRAEAA